MDVPNTVLSAIATMLAAIALVNSRHTAKAELARRNRDLIAEVISANSRFAHAYETMLRERNKTGMPIQDHETELFETINDLVTTISSGNSHLETLMNQKYPNVDDEFHARLLMMRTSTNDIAQIIEIRLDRFKRFNDNRVKELVSAYSKIANRA